MKTYSNSDVLKMAYRWKNMNQTVKQLCNDYASLLLMKLEYNLIGIKHIK